VRSQLSPPDNTAGATVFIRGLATRWPETGVRTCQFDQTFASTTAMRALVLVSRPSLGLSANGRSKPT